MICLLVESLRLGLFYRLLVLWVSLLGVMITCCLLVLCLFDLIGLYFSVFCCCWVDWVLDVWVCLLCWGVCFVLMVGVYRFCVVCFVGVFILFI